MAYYDTVWYVHAGNGTTTGYYAVPQWAASTSTPPGKFIRQKTPPAIGNERVYVAIQATTVNTGTTEPSWTVTRGAKQATDGSVVWMECTGAAGSNGDSVNTPNWTTIKGIGTPSIGAIIQDNNGVSLQICSTAGTLGAASPTFNTTPGATTTETAATTVWTCIGSVASAVDWAAPHARLSNATASNWGLSGNDYYLADNSAETSTAAINISATGGGTISLPSRILSIDHTAALPATSSNLKPGASLATSLAGASAINIGGTQTSNYIYGVTFIASAAYSSAALMLIGSGTASRYRFENCVFSLTGGLTGSVIQFLNNSTQIELMNCTFNLTNAGQMMSVYSGALAWRNTPDPCFTGSIPTIAFRAASSSSGTMLIEGVDFTSLGANTLISTGSPGLYATIKNCKLHSGPVVGALNPAFAASNVDVVSSDSSTGVYRNERHNSFGDLTTSTTVYRGGGAQDGTTPVSHYAVSSTYARSYRPFECLPLVIWNDTVGTTRTVTVYGIVPGTTALPYNDQFWLDIEYMGSTGTPIGSFFTNGLANQLTPHTVVAVADGTSTWTGAGSPAAPFSLSASFTPQQHGYFTIYPRVGASYSVYIDPRPVLS